MTRALAGRLTAIVLAACCLSAAAESHARSEELVVVAWGGASQAAHRDAYWTSFERLHNVQLREASWHGGIGVIRTKVHSRRVNWDVVQVEAEELLLGCEEGLFEILDWQALGGRDQFIGGASDDCGVGALVGAYLIGYDGARLSQGPRHWADFWDVQRTPGKRGMRKTAKYTLEIALLADGVPAGEVYTLLSTEGGLDRAFAKLDQLRPHIVWWTSSSQVPDLLASGEVAMSVATPGRLHIANRTEGRNFKFVWEGNLTSVDFWAILKGSARKEAAMRLIAHMTRADNQARLPRYIPVGVTRKAAQPLIDGQIVPYTPSDEANKRRSLPVDAEFWLENVDQLNQRFFAWVSL
jgi:putative spermidine/putrescine transport system substrate-binding protein